MSTLVEEIIQVSGRPARLLRGGSKSAPATVFVHGGLPGITPYCSGAYVWGGVLQRFMTDRQVIALDLPGNGGTAMTPEPLSVDVIGRFILAALDTLGIDACDLVVHDTSGIAGLWLALEAPKRLRSLSIVASQIATPQGDSLDNLLLLSPPAPLWGRDSQMWAFDRLSYSHLHLDPALVKACDAAAAGEPHRQAVAAAETTSKAFAKSVGVTKYRLWETVRGEGIRVPVQFVWGSHDPAAPREGGYVMFTAVARKQTACQFHMLNRAGSFPFREQPLAFHHVVSAFHAGIAQELAAA